MIVRLDFSPAAAAGTPHGLRPNCGPWPDKCSTCAPVPPGDPLRDDPQRGREPLAPLRAGRVAAAGDRLDHPPVEPRRLDQPRRTDAPLGHPSGERLFLPHANHPLRAAGRRTFVPAVEGPGCPGASRTESAILTSPRIIPGAIPMATLTRPRASADRLEGSMRSVSQDSPSDATSTRIRGFQRLTSPPLSPVSISRFTSSTRTTRTSWGDVGPRPNERTLVARVVPGEEQRLGQRSVSS